MEYEKKTEEAKNQLSMTMAALNRENLELENKKSEKAELITQIEGYKEEAASNKNIVEKTREDVTTQKNKLLEIQADVTKELGVLDDTKNKIKIEEKNLTDFIEKSNKKVIEIGDAKDSLVKDFSKKQKDCDEKIAESEEKKTLLLKDIESSQSILKSLFVQEEEVHTKIDQLVVGMEVVTKESENLNATLRSIKNDIVDQQTLIEKNKMEISSTQTSISELQTQKITVHKELDDLEATKNEFIQAKMVLQADREALSNRELFIMSKYDQAGVAYNQNDILEGTKSYIAEKAALQQMKVDLDKRELFIREKYKKAGLKYL